MPEALKLTILAIGGLMAFCTVACVVLICLAHRDAVNEEESLEGDKPQPKEHQ